KEGQILLICFDVEPEFLDLIKKGILVGSAMQQPYLMGQKAVSSLDDFFNNKKVEKEQKLPILAISKDNLQENLPTIKLNVLGIE
ncbi:MAG: sugar ABC transporter substrate-binding protein, partial [Arcobacter sp.]